MAKPDRRREHSVREAAYYIWEREGRPQGRAGDHWARAVTERSAATLGLDDAFMDDEEKVLAGRPDANFPALLTRDVLGG
jgi:hypothetical protein